MIYYVKELVEKLNTYRNAYYNENKSLVSDKEYDRLYDELCRLEGETGLVYANSPTQTVGYEVVSKLNKVKHNHSLLSLGKTTELIEFASYFGTKPVAIMAKMDGLTCSITYRNGEMVLAESRGNGEVGEDITHNVRTFINLPKRIPFAGELIIDGECIIDYGTFEEINKRENTEYKNPRNLVSGTVRQLDSKVAAGRGVRFVAWKLQSAKDNNGVQLDCTKSYQEAFMFMSNQGFEVVDAVFLDEEDKKHDTDGHVSKWAIDWIKKDSEEKKYPIDGIVGAFDDVEYGLSLGSTSHHPKHSLAFKFYQEANETTLIDIEWATSRTGLVNPVAIVEPVEIDGTTVTRATLSNVSIIKELQLGIGDTVTMIKANQIIPKITDNLTRSDTYVIPTVCPDCGKPIVTKNDNGREMLYCVNDGCPARLHDKISNFASKDGMNIVGISQERLKTLMELNFICDFESVYNLYQHRSEIEKIPGFGKSSVQKLIDAIEVSKKCKFASVIVAIGIPGIGKSSAKALAKYCIAMGGSNALQTLIDCAESNYDWTQLEDFGAVTSNGINEYVRKNKMEIAALIPILEIEDDGEQSNIDNKFGGKSFCVTGKLYVFANRDALVEEIEKYGGKIVSGVTAKTSYLITNDKDSGSSKNAKAAKYGTTIITEQEFIELCKNR